MFEFLQGVIAGNIGTSKVKAYQRIIRNTLFHMKPSMFEYTRRKYKL